MEYSNVLFLATIVSSRVTYIRNGVNLRQVLVMKRTSSTMTLNVRTVKAILIIGNHRSNFFFNESSDEEMSKMCDGYHVRTKRGKKKQTTERILRRCGISRVSG